MEAMSVESLLLSTWEEEGFVGKTRVPVAMSDVDVLAINPRNGKVRIGESKVREGSQRVYVVDFAALADIDKHEHRDFTAWMGDEWSAWLNNIPTLWEPDGTPAVPWLLPASQVTQVEVTFCCNLTFYCDRPQVNDALARAALRFLRLNPTMAKKMKRPDFVKASVTPTVEVLTGLIEAVSRRIESGYGRRFADHFKDIFREIHRYLRPELHRLPCDREWQRLGSRKASFHEAIRRETALRLLRALGIGTDELVRWVREEQ